MMATLWSVEAFVVIPLGAVCLLLLLSDLHYLQRLALFICSLQMAFGAINMTLSSILAFLSTGIFLYQNTVIMLQTPHASNITIEMEDRLRMKEWRNDRNWWIALFACTLWFIVWRLQVWTKRYCLVPPAAAVVPKPAAEKKKD
jgi:hypothetical protein